MESSLLRDLIFDYTLRTVAMGSVLVGGVSGALGAFAVLRRQSLLGDAVAHTALPGIVLAFMLTGSKAPAVLLLGAGLAGFGGAFSVNAIVHRSRIKYDSALGLVLSVFFGLGLVLLTFVQKQPRAAQAGLDRFLFGQASSLLAADLVTFAVLAAVVLLLLGAYWKEFKLLSFDPAFGNSLGLPMRRADYVLTALLVVAITIGLQTVGVVLMSAMIVAPGVAARQWTRHLGRMVALAAGFGAVAGLCGALISSLAPRLPTGPVIILCASAIVALSLLFAPRSGVVWTRWATRRRRRALQLRAALLDLLELASQHDDPRHGHPVATLRAMSVAPEALNRSLEKLVERGWAAQDERGGWYLTREGKRAARQQQPRERMDP